MNDNNAITNKALRLQSKAQRVAAIKAQIAELTAIIAVEEAELARGAIDTTLETKVVC